MFFSAANSNFLENYFAAINFKNIKDDYSGKIAEILEKFFILIFHRQKMWLYFSFSTLIQTMWT
jgi:hypothetical protein